MIDLEFELEDKLFQREGSYFVDARRSINLRI